MFIFKKKRKLAHGFTRTHTQCVCGFTLVEFVVIISIFAIIATVALFNFSGFSSNVSLSNLAHDIALVIREGQVYGISGVAGGPEETVPHGVYFEYSTSSNSFSNDIVVFDDLLTPGDMLYGGGIEYVDTVTIRSSDVISRIETGDITNPQECDDVQGVHIVFRRPDPNPTVLCGVVSSSYARIEVSSFDGSKQKYVEIYPTGQISIQ